MTIKHLASLGQGKRDIARMLGVDESTVRYHVGRMARNAVDGRVEQRQLAEGWSEAVAHYMGIVEGERLNLAEMHDWLRSEHDYPGSLRSLQRYVGRHYPKPKKRARRRVETPPGAQAQADWAVWPRLLVAGREVQAYQFHLRLSHSRYAAMVWAQSKDQLSWHHVHNEAFKRLEGVPACVRVDNEKTAVVRGAGAWGELNAAYKSYARGVRFHIDACPPRAPEYKGKVERGIRGGRSWLELTRRHWASWAELQSWTDVRMQTEALRRVCPATGSTVWEAWLDEKRCLAQLPLLPEPFDVAVTRRVAIDCTVAFESRRYSVPFAHVDQEVEVRGCSGFVQVLAGGRVVAQHERHGPERLVLDPRHYEGDSTKRVDAPTPLGRMGRRLEEIASKPPEQRPIDLYAALAEVAR